MKVQLTYQYRLYPNRQQEKKFRETCDAVRFAYNKLLEDKTAHYKKTRKWKRLDSGILKQYSFLNDVDPGAILWAQNSLETAYKHFFHTERNVPDRYRPERVQAAEEDPELKLMDTDLISYPRYKKKKTTKESYTTQMKDFKVENNRVPLPCVGAVKIRYHRPIPEDAEVICGTVLKKPSGHYFLLVMFYLPEVPAHKPLQTPLGIAFAPGQLAVRSDGEPIFYRHQDAQLQKRMEQAYKKLQRQIPGSNRYEKQRKYLASLYAHRANQRRDDLHKAARQIANAADAIYMQTADVQAQLRKLKGEQERTAVLDEAPWTFSHFVKYKAALDGKWFWSVPRECMTDRQCSGCGTFHKEESQTQWLCSKCGLKLSRYENTARVLQNIAEQYIKGQNL